MIDVLNGFNNTTSLGPKLAENDQCSAKKNKGGAGDECWGRNSSSAKISEVIIFVSRAEIKHLLTGMN